MSVGKNIKTLRETAGFTQKELAEKLTAFGLKVSDKTISSWEIDRTEPNIGVIEKLSAFFGCSKTDIIGKDIKENHYYLNDETRQIAQEILKNPELKALFDASRNATPEDLEFVRQMILKIRKKENHEED